MPSANPLAYCTVCDTQTKPRAWVKWPSTSFICPAPVVSSSTLPHPPFSPQHGALAWRQPIVVLAVLQPEVRCLYVHHSADRQRVRLALWPARLCDALHGGTVLLWEVGQHNLNVCMQDRAHTGACRAGACCMRCQCTERGRHMMKLGRVHNWQGR